VKDYGGRLRKDAWAMLKLFDRELKTRGHFPSDEAATKQIYLKLRSITKKRKYPSVTWKLVTTRFDSIRRTIFRAYTAK
jgi:transposase-like protein